MLPIAIFVFLTIPKLAGQNTDSLSLAKESQHFAFYSTKGDIGVLDSLAIILENNYARIMNRLGIQIEKKINVKVFPYLKSFHAEINYPDAPDWVVGSCIGDELLMVSPLNPGSVHSYGSLMQVIVHEFVHIAVYYACGNKVVTGLPKWLNEGYAQYEAGQINEHIRRSVESSLREKVPPTWLPLTYAPPCIILEASQVRSVQTKSWGISLGSFVSGNNVFTMICGLYRTNLCFLC